MFLSNEKAFSYNMSTKSLFYLSYGETGVFHLIFNIIVLKIGQLFVCADIQWTNE